MAVFFLALPATRAALVLPDATWASVRQAMQERCAGPIRTHQFGPLTLLLAGADASAFEDAAHVFVADGLPLDAQGRANPAGSPLEWLVPLWRRRRSEVLAELDGSFALCCYDRASRELLLARDRFGSRPLFWFDRGDCLFAASECKMLAPVAAPLGVDPRALNEVLASRWIVGEAHLLAPLRQVLAGGFTSVGGGRKAVARRYWRIPFAPERSAPAALRHFVDSTRTGLEQAIARIATGRRRVGVLLSGGVDSSVIAGAARDVADECVGFVARIPDSPNTEMERALIVARHLGISCHVIDVRAPFEEDDVRAMVRRIEEPPRNPNNFILAQLLARMAQESDVALQGDGAEVMFGLVDSMKVARFRRKQRLVSALPIGLRRPLANRLSLSGNARMRGLAGVLQWNPTQYAARLDGIGYAVATQRALPEALSAHEHHLPLEHFAGYGDFDDGLHAYQAYTFLTSSLVRHDRLAQPLGLTSMAPLLQAPVLDVACRLPRELRYTEHSKPVLRALCDAYLPPEVSRWKKMGFEVPWEAWLKRIALPANTLSHAAQVLPSGYAESAPSDPEALWTLITLEMLLDSFDVGGMR